MFESPPLLSRVQNEMTIQSKFRREDNRHAASTQPDETKKLPTRCLFLMEKNKSVPYRQGKWKTEEPGKEEVVTITALIG